MCNHTAVARAFRARRALLFCLALVLTVSPWRPVAAYAAAHAEHVPTADAELGSAADAELVPAAEPVSAADLVLTSASSFMVAAGAAVDEETHLSPAAAVALSLGIVGAVSLLDEPLYNAVLGAATPARDRTKQGRARWTVFAVLQGIPTQISSSSR